ncbi:DUF6912 family protein [Kineococcus glutinatus]|uniref:Type III secretion system (T3SS) SseB-like protein n=1 Tax=Kineococcus glutinatus TaxID=1070872 RepID=A0ABP9HB42_9ACTN
MADHDGQSTRVYLPATLAQLRHLADEGGSTPLVSAPVQAHAVTAALRDWYVDADPRELDDELEYAASSDAAERSLHLLAADPLAPRRRVVLAVDVPAGHVRATPPTTMTGTGRSAVLITADVPRAALVSVHVDDHDAVPDVRTAVEALPAAEAGDEDAQFVVEAVEGHELLWYDATEVDDLIALD